MAASARSPDLEHAKRPLTGPISGAADSSPRHATGAPRPGAGCAAVNDGGDDAARANERGGPNAVLRHLAQPPSATAARAPRRSAVIPGIRHIPAGWQTLAVEVAKAAERWAFNTPASHASCQSAQDAARGSFASRTARSPFSRPIWRRSSSVRQSSAPRRHRPVRSSGRASQLVSLLGAPSHASARYLRFTGRQDDGDGPMAGTAARSMQRTSERHGCNSSGK
jgi:hypothetical protein